MTASVYSALLVMILALVSAGCFAYHYWYDRANISRLISILPRLVITWAYWVIIQSAPEVPSHVIALRSMFAMLFFVEIVNFAGWYARRRINTSHHS